MPCPEYNRLRQHYEAALRDWGHVLLGTPHETEIYVRLQRVDVMFSIVWPDNDNELHPVQERRSLYLDLADYERLR
jgi:hypothetical protein